MQIGRSLYPVQTGYSVISDMQERMDKLQTQLGTGERASTLSELGNERVYDLTIRSRLQKIEAYSSNIDTVNLRIDIMSSVVSRLDEIEADGRSTAVSGGGQDGIGIVTAQSLATARLDEVLTVLRTDVNGRYVFGGTNTDVLPVETSATILDGSGSRAGFRTVTDQRQLADLGSDGRGRLVSDSATLTAAMPATDTVSLTESDATISPHRPEITGIATSNAAEITVTAPAGVPVSVSAQFSAAVADGDTVTIDITLADGTVEAREFTAVAGAPATSSEFQIGVDGDETATNFQDALNAVMITDTVTLAEDGSHIFGMKLGTLSTDSAAVSLSQPAGGPPPDLSIRFTDAPLAGEVISIGVTMPDGTDHTMTFKATTDTTPSEAQFTIGASVEETTANFLTAMNTEIERVGKTELAAASVYAAADNFFAGQNETAQRVDGPPYETATGLVAATSTDTVIWYNGEDSAGRARDTVKASVDDGTTVSYGVQANEAGIADLVRSLAAMAVESYPDGDENATDRFNAMNSRQLTRLSEGNNSQTGSLEIISLELGIAYASNGQAEERHTSYTAQLETLLADIEQVSTEEVAVELLALQTRLQASYQTMSMVSKLSLVNYL